MADYCLYPGCRAAQGELHTPECPRFNPGEWGNPLDGLKASVAARIHQLTDAPQPERLITFRDNQLARMLCELQGHDPYARVVDINQAKRTGPFGAVIDPSVVHAWTLYLPLAKEVIDALDRKEVSLGGTQDTAAAG